MPGDTKLDNCLRGSISIKPSQVSILCPMPWSRWPWSYETGPMPRASGSPSVIIANKILITQECSVSPCKINPQPGPLSRLDQAEPRADPATPGPPPPAIMWPGQCPLSLSAEGGSSGITRGSMRTLIRNQSRTYLICKSFHLLGRRHGHCERTQVT